MLPLVNRERRYVRGKARQKAASRLNALRLLFKPARKVRSPPEHPPRHREHAYTPCSLECVGYADKLVLGDIVTDDAAEFAPNTRTHPVPCSQVL